MALDFALQFSQLVRQFLVQGQRFAQADERAHNGDVDMYGALAPQHAGKHGDSLLGERGDGFPPAAVSGT